MGIIQPSIVKCCTCTPGKITAGKDALLDRYAADVAKHEGNVDDNEIININDSDVNFDRIKGKFINAVLEDRLLDAMYLMELFSDKIELSDHIFNDGNNVLHYAVQSKNENKSKFTVFLLQNGVDVDVVNNLTGNTALHISVGNDDVKMSGILIKWNANIYAKNNEGKTPKSIAMDVSDGDMMELFDSNALDYISQINNNKNGDNCGLLSNNEFKKEYISHLSSKNIIQISNNDSETVIVSQSLLKSDSQTIVMNINDTKTNDNSDRDIIDCLDDSNIIMTDDTFVDLDSSAKSTHITSILTPDNITTETILEIMTPKLKKQSTKSMLEFVAKESNAKAKVYYGWVNKRSDNNDSIYNKRYLCIHDGYLLWNPTIINMDNIDDSDGILRNKWKKKISLFMIENDGIKLYDDKQEFGVELKKVTGVKKKTLYFRCNIGNHVCIYLILTFNYLFCN